MCVTYWMCVAELTGYIQQEAKIEGRQSCTAKTVSETPKDFLDLFCNSPFNMLSVMHNSCGVGECFGHKFAGSQHMLTYAQDKP